MSTYYGSVSNIWNRERDYTGITIPVYEYVTYVEIDTSDAYFTNRSSSSSRSATFDVEDQSGQIWYDLFTINLDGGRSTRSPNSAYINGTRLSGKQLYIFNGGNQTTPAEDGIYLKGTAKVRVDTAPCSYTLTRSAGAGGSLSVTAPDGTSPTSVPYGTSLYCSATPNRGYSLSGLTFNGTGINNNTSHAMPAGDITVAASFSKVSYSINKSPGTGGSISVKKGGNEVTSANYGDSLVVSASPSTGYSLKTLKFNGTAITTGSTVSMPDTNITVEATFTKNTYTVTKSAGTGGSISVKKGGSEVSSAQYGDSLVVSASASDGYTLFTLKFNDGNISSGQTVSMPAGNVTAAATFTKNTYNVTKDAGTGGSLSVKKGGSETSTSQVGDSLVITATPATNYELESLTVNGASFTSGGTYTAPAGNVTVTARFRLAVTPVGAPTSVTMTADGNVAVISVSGGTAGVANPVTGYGISTRTRDYTGSTWSAWGADEAWLGTDGSGRITIPSNKVMQIRARSLGEMGEGFHSAYKECATTLPGWTACTAPTFAQSEITVKADTTAMACAFSGAQAGAAGSNIAGYRVYFSTSPTGPWVDSGRTLSAGATAVDLEGPGNPGASTYYALKTLSTVSGFDSGYSTPIRILATYGDCRPPQSLRCTPAHSISGHPVKLYWDAGTDGKGVTVTGYKVFRVSGSTYTLIDTVTGREAWVNPTSGATSQQYAVQCVSSPSGFEGAYSTPVTAYFDDTHTQVGGLGRTNGRRPR